jgi:hypothetical protein
MKDEYPSRHPYHPRLYDCLLAEFSLHFVRTTQVIVSYPFLEIRYCLSKDSQPCVRLMTASIYDLDGTRNMNSSPTSMSFNDVFGGLTNFRIMSLTLFWKFSFLNANRQWGRSLPF